MSSKDATRTPARTLDRRGRLRSPASMPGFHKGRAPATKGRSLPPDPPSVEDIVALLEQCKPLRAGRKAELSAMRLRALVIVLWRTGLRISEALALEERDLNRADLAVTVRRGKNGKRRISAMDEWGWQQIEGWLTARKDLPFGAIFCVLSGPTAGQSISDSDARRQLRQAARRGALRRRMNPHSFRHAFAVELRREKIDLYAIQQTLGHCRLDVTQEYLRSISTTDVLEPIGHRRAPMMQVPTM